MEKKIESEVEKIINYIESLTSPSPHMIIEYIKTEYIKTMTIRPSDIGLLIAKYKYLQTPEMIDYYLSLNPPIESVEMLIESCPYAQTPEMLEYYLSLHPDSELIENLLMNCKYARSSEIMWEHYIEQLRILDKLKIII